MSLLEKWDPNPSDGRNTELDAETQRTKEVPRAGNYAQNPVTSALRGGCIPAAGNARREAAYGPARETRGAAPPPRNRKLTLIIITLRLPPVVFLCAGSLADSGEGGRR